MKLLSMVYKGKLRLTKSFPRGYGYKVITQVMLENHCYQLAIIEISEINCFDNVHVGNIL